MLVERQLAGERRALALIMVEKVEALVLGRGDGERALDVPHRLVVTVPFGGVARALPLVVDLDGVPGNAVRRVVAHRRAEGDTIVAGDHARTVVLSRRKEARLAQVDDERWRQREAHPLVAAGGVDVEPAPTVHHAETLAWADACLGRRIGPRRRCRQHQEE